MPKATITVDYVNQPRGDKGPGNIKDSEGRYFKVWKTTKIPNGATLGDFEANKTYDIDYSEKEYPAGSGKMDCTVSRILSASTSTNGATATNGGNGNGHESADSRSANIQRQHSQEMALRYAEIQAAFSKILPTFEDVQALTDQFQLDIARVPMAYDPVADAKEVFKATEAK